MKPFIKIVRTEVSENYTLALITEQASDVASTPFGTYEQETKISAINIKTGEPVKEEFLSIGDVSEKVSLRVDGKVVKLTPTIRTGINYTETQLSSLGEVVLKNLTAPDATLILEDPTYKEFERHAIDALGLGANVNSEPSATYYTNTW